MIREILTSEYAVLRQKAKKVKRVDPAINQLIEDMLETMRAAPGVGLAAPQIGVSLRVLVAETPIEDEEGNDTDRMDQIVVINPEIVELKGEQTGEEGCLSIPGYVGLVKRATHVTIKGLNRKGKEVKIRRSGFPARVLQHEIDHLEGVLFTDRLASPADLYRVGERGERQPIIGGHTVLG